MKKIMKISVLSLFSVLLVLLTLAAVETFFIFNNKFNFIKPIDLFKSNNPVVLGEYYDLKPLALNYIDNIKPYSEKSNTEGLLDYGDAFKFKECSSPALQTMPYWLGRANCKSRIILKKLVSRLVIYDVFYSFNKNYLRTIPAAQEVDNFLLFLGCSFTYGEGLEDEEIFANQVTKKLAPANGFNLGMGGYGPHLTLQLLEQKKSDIRLSAIKGNNGVAIYTFIDDHLRRLTGSMSWIWPVTHNAAQPYYFLDKGLLKSAGNFDTHRPITTWFYQTLAKTEFAKFFRIELPLIGDDEIELFIQIVLKMKKNLKEKFNIDKFVFSIYPGQKQFVTLFKDRLEKEGIILFDFSTVDIYRIMHGREAIFNNGHPSALAHKFYSDLLVYELKKRKLN